MTFDEPYTLPWEHEYPRNDCNASGGYGAVVKGEKHETSDYERGLNDAWIMARNIVISEKDGGIPYAQLASMFHTSDIKKILRDYSVFQAEEKLKALEEKNEIKVGDEIVYKDGVKGVVVGISNNGQISVLNDKYAVPQLLIKNDATKTGKHYDQIEEVLKQMQEETK